MTPETAQAVAAAVRRVGMPLTAKSAAAVIDAWGVAERFPRDRGGNFVTGERRRVQLGKQVVREQSRGSGGVWRNDASSSLIAAGTKLALAAAKVLGDDALAAGARGQAQSRAKAKQQARSRRDLEKLRGRAREVAAKHVAADHPEWLRAATLAGEIDAAHRAVLAREANEATQVYLDALLEGRAAELPDDGKFASVDRPPWLPFVMPGVEYRWTESSQAGPVVVHVHRRYYGSGLAANLTSEDGVVVYGLLGRDAAPVATGIVAELIEVLHPEASSAQTAAVLRLWCRLVAGYGVASFPVALRDQAATEAVARLVDAGVLRASETDARGRLVLACGGGEARANPRKIAAPRGFARDWPAWLQVGLDTLAARGEDVGREAVLRRVADALEQHLQSETVAVEFEDLDPAHWRVHVRRAGKLSVLNSFEEKDDEGEPLGYAPFTVTVDPACWSRFRITWEDPVARRLARKHDLAGYLDDRMRGALSAFFSPASDAATSRQIAAVFGARVNPRRADRRRRAR